MGRNKRLRENRSNNINMVDMFSPLSFEKNSKYTEMFLRIIKKTEGLDMYVNEVKQVLTESGLYDREDLNGLTDFEIISLSALINIIDSDDIKNFKKFGEYNERKLIANNDLNTYKNFSEVTRQVEMVEMANVDKEMTKQVVTLIKNKEWLVIRPLTYQASKKYGANTKWCTTSSNSDNYFNNYAEKGVLIYCINMRTGYKVAVFKELRKGGEFSFWDDKDARVDSIETELTPDVMALIVQECKDKNAISNLKLKKTRKINVTTKNDPTENSSDTNGWVDVRDSVIYNSESNAIRVSTREFDISNFNINGDDGIDYNAYINSIIGTINRSVLAAGGNEPENNDANI